MRSFHQQNLLRMKNKRVLLHHQLPTDKICFVFSVTYCPYSRKLKKVNRKVQRLQCQNIKKTNKLSHISRKFYINVLCRKPQIVNLWIFCEWKKISLAPPDSFFAIKKNINKNFRSLHKIMEEIFCTKIKISLARSLFSKTKSEDQCTNFVWPKAIEQRQVWSAGNNRNQRYVKNLAINYFRRITEHIHQWKA